MLRPFTIAGIRTTAYTELLMLFLVYLEAFLAPESIDAFEVYEPAPLSKLYCYPAIAISRMLHVQDEQIVNYRLILLRQFRLIPLRTSGLPQHSASPALRRSQLSANLLNNLSSPGRDYKFPSAATFRIDISRA